MPDELNSDPNYVDSPVSRPSRKLRSSALFWIGSVAALFLAVCTLTICLIAILIIRERSDRAQDIDHYHALRAILEEVRAERISPSPDFSGIRARAATTANTVVSDLKQRTEHTHPERQALLFAARDDLPRMMQGDLLTESTAETGFAAHLDSAAQVLNLK